MYFNRWATFAASALVQVSCSGIAYCFSILAPLFKDTFNLSERQVSTIGSLGFNLGGYLALISGSVYNSLRGKNHLAPRLVVWIGVFMLLFGYGGIYACAVGMVTPTYPILLGLALVAGNAGTWFDTAAIVTNIQNFPDDRGTVVGILKAFLGLSGTLYASVYSSTFSKSTTNFVLFLAIVPSTFALFMSIFINLVPKVYHEMSFQSYHVSDVALSGPEMELAQSLPHSHHATAQRSGSGHHYGGSLRMSKAKRFLMVYLLVAIVALYGMVSSVWSSEHRLDSQTRQMITGVLLALLSAALLIPLSVGPLTHPRRRLHEATEPQHEQLEAGGQGSITPLLTPRATLSEQQKRYESEEDEDMTQTVPPVEMGPMQMARTPSFWLIFYTYAIGVGTGLTLLNNLASIVLTLGGKEGGQVVFVALFSVANASGRLLNGYVSEYFLHSYGTARTNFLSVVAVLMTAVSLTGYLTSATGDLYPLALLAGLAFGGFWSVIPAIVSDIFGLTNFASNYTILQLAPACGGYLMATVLATYGYAHASIAQGGDGSNCAGTACYSSTWMVLAALNGLSVISTRILVARTLDVYERMKN